MAEIRLSSVRKSYTKTLQVIHGVDVQIADGEFIVIVGPSGCGKSTLLRMIAGLETITDGEIAIAGSRVNDVEPKDRNIAMVFQNYALYPHMSVYDNMAYGLRIRGLSKADIETRVQRAAKILELGSFLQRKPRELSGGQRQRVAMGRAIVREPAAFLFDEPLSNLDAKLRVQMRLEIQKLHRELKTTSIFVTHDQVEAMTLADRMIVMNLGVVEQVGRPIEVYDKPASLFVATFIGSPSMNLLPGKRVGDELDIGGGVRLPIPADQRANAGELVTAGIRPEHLVAAGPGPQFKLTVETIEALGADSMIHGLVGDSALVARVDGHETPEPGAALTFSVMPGKIHFFDTASGKRLAA
ncbi:sn-glycerol-3-phosphate import ATP-binding protein UgpC [Usitatibacter palustris]|uniref:sn-glycerol-3-phosphate import ATP-binding protein UgpC n=1 Tax=Usitatibacter palustris TaxID=2732487 RepID=A0A6M4H782_9PROT|nr:sn-glycerol-3-phosphate import ATP-binding protein UgpC [Usitatibacter palustris]QJR14543.1 sn-glycerol-3-phosphate import ATP-binding protein UgpC [Usitatibacter palustris]